MAKDRTRRDVEELDIRFNPIGAVITGTAGNDILCGTDDDDVIYGLGGDDTLCGYNGNDTLDGGIGADTMYGGMGDDTYTIDDFNDTVTEYANEGIDIVLSSITYTLGDNIEDLTLTGNRTIDGHGNGLNNYITGNDAANVLSGGAGQDTLSGGTGNDTLYGGEDDDILNGGAGADTMFGSTGNDTYKVDNTGDTVIEYANEGIDTVLSSITYTLGENVENLTLTGDQAINGYGNGLDNRIEGNNADNVLEGGTGNDTLYGNDGNDTLYGGKGNDTYVVDDTGDTVIEYTNEGIDTVQSPFTYTLGNNLENLILAGIDVINGYGNGLDNRIEGNNADNALYGYDGNDTLDGGKGADTMYGGTGSDTYVVDHTGDTVIEYAKEGIDTVKSSITYTLGENMENLTLTGDQAINGYGNDLNNYIIGNDADNILEGGKGDDIYVVDNESDKVIENANEGVDLIYSSVAYTLSDNVEDLALTGDKAINGTGNALDNTLYGNDADNVLKGNEGNDRLNGGAGNDTLYGGEGNDILYGGGAGNDFLDGGEGADTMYGGKGDDTYVVDNAGDKVTENANEGIDTIISSTNMYFMDLIKTKLNPILNVESLILEEGSDAIDGWGNYLDNVITGNENNNRLKGEAGNDTLYGGAGNDTIYGNGDYGYFYGIGDNDLLDGGEGADTMYGGKGDDTYVVDNTGDKVTENANEGIDTVQSSVTYTLSENVEDLTLTGSDAIDGTGNALNNYITGNSANNTLYGNKGNDTLDGGKGNDTLSGGAGSDAYGFSLGNGSDVIDDCGSDNAQDTISFDASVSRDAIAFFEDGTSLHIAYEDTDYITILNQDATGIEKVQLSDGFFLTDSDINKLIQGLTSYANDHGISLTSVDDVKNNQELMNIIVNSWHQ